MKKMMVSTVLTKFQKLCCTSLGPLEGFQDHFQTFSDQNLLQIVFPNIDLPYKLVFTTFHSDEKNDGFRPILTTKPCYHPFVYYER